ncbi:MAG: XTP/dITP diphosphatase [Roseiflexaceae bacterium]|nr:XTP/dITP diphosphatase [Roseiflexaceae bacterium]
MTELLIATTNQGKLREYSAILETLPLTLRSLADVAIADDVEETGATFAENAQLKALYYAAQAGLPALADDSGLEVAALDGAPGVYSARFAGHGASDADRIALLLQKLDGVPFHARLARFVCTIAIALPDGTCEIVEGILPGVIENAPRGSNGFGYDPIFYVLDEDRTLAEIPTERKNAISHRARAAQAARDVLARWVAEGRIS